MNNNLTRTLLQTSICLSAISSAQLSDQQLSDVRYMNHVAGYLGAIGIEMRYIPGKTMVESAALDSGLWKKPIGGSGGGESFLAMIDRMFPKTFAFGDSEFGKAAAKWDGDLETFARSFFTGDDWTKKIGPASAPKKVSVAPLFSEAYTDWLVASYLAGFRYTMLIDGEINGYTGGVSNLYLFLMPYLELNEKILKQFSDADRKRAFEAFQDECKRLGASGLAKRAKDVRAREIAAAEAKLKEMPQDVDAIQYLVFVLMSTDQYKRAKDELGKRSSLQDNPRIKVLAMIVEDVPKMKKFARDQRRQ